MPKDVLGRFRLEWLAERLPGPMKNPFPTEIDVAAGAEARLRGTIRLGLALGRQRSVPLTTMELTGP